MKLTEQENQFVMTLMAQAWAYADNHENADERRALSMSIMDKLAEQLYELNASVSRHPAGKMKDE
jgi:hypothetical protein